MTAVLTVGERLDEWVEAHYEPNDRNKIRGWCGVNDDVRDKFLDYLKTNHASEYKWAEQILIREYNNIPLQSERLRPLFSQYMKLKGINPDNLCGLNSGDGEYMALQFEQWVKKTHFEIWEAVDQWDSVHGIEYGTSFGAVIMEWEN